MTAKPRPDQMIQQLTHQLKTQLTENQQTHFLSRITWKISFDQDRLFLHYRETEIPRALLAVVFNTVERNQLWQIDKIGYHHLKGVMAHQTQGMMVFTIGGADTEEKEKTGNG